MKGINGGW